MKIVLLLIALYSLTSWANCPVLTVENQTCASTTNQIPLFATQFNLTTSEIAGLTVYHNNYFDVNAGKFVSQEFYADGRIQTIYNPDGSTLRLKAFCKNDELWIIDQKQEASGATVQGVEVIKMNNGRLESEINLYSSEYELYDLIVCHQ